MSQIVIMPGSLSAIAQASGQTIAESFVGADAVIIVDTSASMDAADSRGGLTRYSVACEELARLQHDMPGKLAVIAFSSAVMFCPNGQPYQFHGGTNLADALKFARLADVPGIKFFVISDGYPDGPAAALAEAAKFKAPISTIHTGPENDRAGKDFLSKLAIAAGGATVNASRVLELADKMRPLLQAGQ